MSWLPTGIDWQGSLNYLLNWSPVAGYIAFSLGVAMMGITVNMIMRALMRD